MSRYLLALGLAAGLAGCAASHVYPVDYVTPEKVSIKEVAQPTAEPLLGMEEAIDQLSEELLSHFNPDEEKRAAAAGIKVVSDRCFYVEHRKYM